MKVTIVTSADNPQVRDMASLLTARGRRKGGTFLAEGFMVIEEAVRAGLIPVRLAVQNEVIESDRMRALLKLPGVDAAPVLKVPRGIVKKLSAVETPQGVVAEIRRPDPLRRGTQRCAGLAVACECIQDPRNLGLLARAAHAAGACTLFLGPGSTDPFHAHAVNGSAGSVFHLNIVANADMDELLSEMRAEGTEVWAAAASGGEPLPRAVAAAGDRMLLLLGNEGAGLSPALQARADRLVSIPMPGGAESLNIAVSAAVILFAFVMKNSA
jgi:TrmH family RNA methyltransferase